MAFKSLNQLKSLIGEPQLMHRWRIQVPTWPAAVGAPDNPDIMFLVTTSDMPQAQDEPAEASLGGFPMKFNGKEIRSGELTWTFFQGVDQAVINYFFVKYANAKQQFTTDKEITMAAATTAELTAPKVNMQLLDNTGENVTKTFQLLNVLFKPQTSGDQLGQDASIQQPTVMASFDSFIIF